MKIAIVAPSPQPFVIGGAEKFWLGLYSAFNTYTPHPCELFKIPVTESNFWDLMDSYRDFYSLDFSGFDMLITSKYPAWMCRHDNHLVYMQHTLRGLYDTYTQSIDPGPLPPAQQYVLDIVRNDTSTIDDIFEGLAFLRETVDLQSSLFAFPAPFVRLVIHALDRKALKKARVYNAISQTVANRVDYFPEHAEVHVLHHPTTLQHFSNKEAAYFFTASRLDYAKRLDLVIKAYLDANVAIPLKIAGTGPHEAELRALANNDPRIEFLGFITDAQLLEHYSRACAVPFIPLQEDYGLITIEAMHCEKPVITCTDSGGCTEFVNEQTGYLCEPDVPSLAAAFRAVAEHPEQARERGKNAAASVRHITWENTVQELLQRGTQALSDSTQIQQSASPERRRKKLLSLSTYPIFPPRGGGQNRMYYLYKDLAQDYDIELLCLGYAQKERTEISPGLWETCLSRTQSWFDKENEYDRLIGTSSGDIVFLDNLDTIPDFEQEALRLAADADVLLLEHPYCYPLVERLGLPFIFSTHNFEYALKKAIYASTPECEALLSRLLDVERKAYTESVCTIFTCDEDARVFEQYLGAREKTYVIYNGYDANTVPYTPPAQRRYQRTHTGYVKPVALFMGSWHKPNIESVEYILDLARQTDEFEFVIVGSVGGYFDKKSCPAHVHFAGVVDDTAKAAYLALADVALNPMFSGSGTNLKMLDFMGAGIPLVSTPVGARGHVLDDTLFLCRNLEAFPQAMRDAVSMNPEPAASYAFHFFSWPVLARRYRDILAACLR